MVTTILEVEDLSAGYGRIPVLHAISFSVQTGEVLAILGRNGAGKTTLLRAISGAKPPSKSGRILFQGAALPRGGARHAAAAGLVHVPEGRQVFPELTVRQNLHLGTAAMPRRVRLEREESLIEEAFEYFPRLRERVDQRAGTLSGGEQQMLAIGRGLMGSPRLLLIDEPSLGLAPIMTTQMYATLTRLVSARSISVVVVEQNIQNALALSDRYMVLADGVISVSRPSVDARRDAGMLQAYLG